MTDAFLAQLIPAQSATRILGSAIGATKVTTWTQLQTRVLNAKKAVLNAKIGSVAQNATIACTSWFTQKMANVFVTLHVHGNKHHQTPTSVSVSVTTLLLMGDA